MFTISALCLYVLCNLAVKVLPHSLIFLTFIGMIPVHCLVRLDNCVLFFCLNLQVTAASISSFARHEVKGELVKLLKYPIYFEYTNGVIGKIYASEIESVFCANVKKGLLSLFQIQETEGQRDEVCVDSDIVIYYRIKHSF